MSDPTDCCQAGLSHLLLSEAERATAGGQMEAGSRRLHRDIVTAKSSSPIGTIVSRDSQDKMIGSGQCYEAAAR